jgi:uncharacterized protein
MNMSDELQKLQQLRESGALSDDEYAQAKAKLLSPESSSGSAAAGVVDVEGQTRLWAMLLHLSLLAGFAVPLGGLIVPIVIWQIKKKELPGIDMHGKIAANWIISALIYTIVGVLLVFVAVGIPLLLAGIIHKHGDS